VPLRKSFNANDLIFRTVEDGLEGVRAPEVDRIRLTNYTVDGPPAWAARGAATECSRRRNSHSPAWADERNLRIVRLWLRSAPQQDKGEEDPANEQEEKQPAPRAIEASTSSGG